ncbi:MAG: terminase [Candidatus Acidiferrales bacterium]
MTAEQELIGDIGSFSLDPLGFTRYVFPWGSGALTKPRAFQADTLQIIGEHLSGPNRFQPLQLAICSGHGIGKSALIAFILNWAMSTCDDCRGIITAGKEEQMATKTWPEVSKWFNLAINRHWWELTATKIHVKEAKHRDSWRIDRVTWSKENVDTFAGLHNQGKRIVVIFDESSTIDDRIWEVTEGALTDEKTEILWLAFGNPTQNTGRFRECFGKFKHRWVQKQIDSRDVEGTNKELYKQWVSDWGEDSDFVRIRVRGEFPRAGSSQFIAGDIVNEARKRNVGDQSKAHKILSVDVARFGSNQTVIGWRQGLRAKITDKMRGKDTIETGKQVIMRIIQERPRSVVIDGDGIGGGVVDYVRTYLPEVWKERGLECVTDRDGTVHLPKWFRLEEFHGGTTPGDSFMYFNRRAEVWGKMRDWLVTGEIPDDAELADELTGPEYFISNKNQIQLEKKEDMESRGLSSPDNGDMLAMTFGVTPALKTREESLVEELARCADPLERHFMRLRETERREKAKQPLQYWE